MNNYNHLGIEKKWQEYWERKSIFKCNSNSSNPKYYILDMFPYPSGAGLHVGHPEGYTASDIIARYKRMNGFNVLHPFGWDAFGLPAENYAIKSGTHPEITTKLNVENFKKQIQSLGFSYDWSREINTTDPGYYRWTQWIFLKLFERGLAYEKEMPINFCPDCKTGLANEEVIDGCCERCGSITEKRLIKQWILKITEYADRLLDDLDLLDWPESIKAMQRNWIGKSIGAEVDFNVEGFDKKIVVYTTRIDTIFSGTFLILAPEHELVESIVKEDFKESVYQYVDRSLKKTEIDRTNTVTEKDGVFTGAYAINPANGYKMPIWISDFVISGYGKGAVFGDAHDERDFLLAKKYDIPLKVSIRPTNDNIWEEVKKIELCYSGEGTLINSEQFDGMTSSEAKIKILSWLEEKGFAKKQVYYKLRDWIFSRQRYWGEPIPLIHCECCGIVPLNLEDLPLLLPKVDNYHPTGTGESPLACIEDWVNTKCHICGNNAKRETNTMPQWAGSCWYYLRYMDPSNSNDIFNRDIEKYFMGEKGVDLYIGGAEHAVLHLLYARFWHKVLYDMGLVSQKEPFFKLKNQGMILGEDNEKMSKSRGNVVNPNEVINKYGADSFRLYEMFMGPFESVKPWNTKGIVGLYRFLQKVWKIFTNIEITEDLLSNNQQILMHKLTKKVTSDIEDFHFNTSISQMMIFINELSTYKQIPREMVRNFLLLLSPFAPHISEELWCQLIDPNNSLTYVEWPKYNDTYTKTNEVEYIIQINGKMRGKFVSELNLSKENAILEAKKVQNIQKYLSESIILNEIFISNKLINFVIRN